MDSFEFNKIAGAVLGTALMVFGLNELAGIIYHPHAPEKPGFAVEVAEGRRRGRRDRGGRTGSPGRVRSARCWRRPMPAKGQAGFKACAACHDCHQGRSQQGRAPTSGASWARMHGVHDGFAYSEAMAAKSDEPWTYEALNEFLTAPKKAIPGTKMAYRRPQEGRRTGPISWPIWPRCRTRRCPSPPRKGRKAHRNLTPASLLPVFSFAPPLAYA